MKSILDVPATAELLETLGVPVLGYRTDDLPLFYAAHGGPPVSARVESAAEAARIARRTGSSAGTPRSWSAARRRQPGRRRAADRAGARGAHEQGVTGQAGDALRPLLLHRESGGRTLGANRELIAANAASPAEIAVAYAAL